VTDERFTDDALRQMAEQLPGKPVTVNFDPSDVIGRVTSAKVTEDGLVLTLDPASIYPAISR
jgi:hypothetical protein